MSVQVIEVKTSRDLNRFIEFNYDLYKNHPYAVPELYMDLKGMFNPKKNPALRFCEAQPFIAVRDGKVVGRIVGIINTRANETWDIKVARFGWIDFIDDIEVSRALIDTVSEWGRQRGMNTLQGPLGFTDMDREGMLIEGFDKQGTMSTYYNYPYYPEHMEKLGLEKEIDWVERYVLYPDKMPEKYERISQIAAKRSNLRIFKLTNMKQLREGGWGKKLFELINASYAPLFGYSKLDDEQIKQLVDTYLPMIDLRMQSLILNEKDELVGCGLCMPSIVKALQKSGGKLFPFGWYHLLKSLKWKHEDGVELLLVAVHPDYQGKGVNALIFYDLIPIFGEMGFKWAETNPQLETNFQSQAQWDYLPNKVIKKRRCYKKPLNK